MPGLFCYSLDEDSGFDREGRQIGKALAYCQVHWDRYEYENPGKLRPDKLREVTPEAPIRQRTMEDLERERQDIAERDRRERLKKTLNRGKRVA